MKPSTYFQVTGALFLIIATVHVLRLISRWEAVIGGWEVPLWLSGIAVIISGYLAYQGLTACSKK